MSEDAMPGGGSRGKRVGSVLAAMALAAALRLLPWGQVFTPQGVRFLPDTDPHYHVMRAERILKNYPTVPWTDPNLNYPYGAEIVWPPLFDQVIASAAWALTGGNPTRARLEQVAAFVPVAIGVATIPLVAELAGLLVGSGTAAGAALLLALLPVHIAFGALGRPDQHVAELFVFCWILVAFVRCWRGAGPRGVAAWVSPASLGVAIATAFWTWPGSALYLLVLMLFAASWHLAAPAGDPVGPRVHRALATGSGIGAGLLAISVPLWAPAGALTSMELNGVTGVQVVVTLAAASFGALLWLASRMSGSPGTWRRLGQVALAGLLPAAAALPAIRDVVARGLVALGAANSWYPHIVEFRPLLSPGTGPIWAGAFSAVAELGIGPLLMALAVPGLTRRWKDGPEERAAVLLLAVLGGGLLALALLRLRFELYLSLPLVLLSAFYGNEAATPLSRRIPYLAFGLLSLVLVGKAALHKPVIGSFVGEDLVGALQWLRGQDPAVPGAESVLARWDWGHAIQYYAGKPVLVSPFGTEAGRGAMEDSAAFFFARTPADAEAVLARRRIGFLLLDDPLGGAHQSLGFAPAGTSSAVRATYEWMRGERLEPTEAFWDLVPVALFRFDGVPRTGARALDGYRLLYESPPGNPIKWGPEGQFKIFGVVPGASLAVAPVPPGTPVAVSVQVHTNQGRAFTWTASDRASATGVAVLRLPYATGHNGAVTAGPALVSEPSSRQEVVVPATAVEHGERLEVALPR